MKNSIPILPLNDNEKLWMEEVYKRNLTGERFTMRDIWSVLHSRLPRDFRPAAMDSRLIDPAGEKIRMLGILALQSDYSILTKVNQVIEWIWSQLLAAPSTTLILTESVAGGVGLPRDEVHLIFSTVQEFGRFYYSIRSSANNLFITAIELGNGEDVYIQYANFPGIEQLMIEKLRERNRQPTDLFTPDERQAADDKLDELLREVQLLKAGQEAIWTDIRRNIEELKALYFLGKKNWRQLLLGKLTEMTASGVVSDTISKWAEEMFKSGVSMLLPWSG